MLQCAIQGKRGLDAFPGLSLCLQCVALSCNVLQCVAVCCSVQFKASKTLTLFLVSLSPLYPGNLSLLRASKVLMPLICVAECCSVLQCVAVCCSVLQCVAVCCSGQARRGHCSCFSLAISLPRNKAISHLRAKEAWMLLLCVAVCCSVLQCVALCHRVLQCATIKGKRGSDARTVCCSMLQCVAVCRIVLQCAIIKGKRGSGALSVCCSVLQSVAVRCSLLILRAREVYIYIYALTVGWQQ